MGVGWGIIPHPHLFTSTTNMVVTFPLQSFKDPTSLMETTLASAGVVFPLPRKCNSGKRPGNVHDLKAWSFDSSKYFHRLRATLYFSVVVVSPNTLRGVTLIRATVLFSRFSDSTRSKVSPTFT